MQQWKSLNEYKPPLMVRVLVWTTEGPDIAVFDGTFWEGMNNTYPVDGIVQFYAEINTPNSSRLPPPELFVYSDDGIVNKLTNELVKCRSMNDKQFNMLGMAFEVVQGTNGCIGCVFDTHVLCSVVDHPCDGKKIFRLEA